MPPSLLLLVFAALSARDFPALPAVPALLLDGKEGVDGSSPSEGSKRPAKYEICVVCAELQVRRGHSQAQNARGAASLRANAPAFACAPEVARQRERTASGGVATTARTRAGCASRASTPTHRVSSSPPSR
jgi:hypothetical protein